MNIAIGVLLPLAREVMVWYLENSGRTSISLDDLKAKTPDELLAEVGVVL